MWETEKSSAKPPLPKSSLFHMGTGVYRATLDFVQSLCDTSWGLVDVFPMEDRRLALQEMIVKSGDDCRQEHLAVQLIAQFYDIFQEGLPLWLRPYEVLVTSSHTALIETIYDTASIHSIKSRYANLANLRDIFCKKYEEGSPSFKLAQRNFVESMAGYSILCYFLQVKDRHNSNLLLDEDGHIIHIDFWFMLSNSPGNVHFERAPFKLSRELLEVNAGSVGADVVHTRFLDMPEACRAYYLTRGDNAGFWMPVFQGRYSNNPTATQAVSSESHRGAMRIISVVTNQQQLGRMGDPAI